MKRMFIHSRFLPYLHDALRRAANVADESEIDEIIDAASTAVVFDCRKLPLAFVEDTGAVAWEDYRECKNEIHLPFGLCYFEFDGFGVAVYRGIYADGSYDIRVAGYQCEDSQSLSFFKRVIWPLEPDDENDVAVLVRAKQMVLGILTLLGERLVGTELKPDPNPIRSAKLKKQRRAPMSSDVHVLTINIAAVRRIAVSPIGTHESPRLHWRRGHWRILHRGSEFQTKAWVTKCLVGDIERGFVTKSYKLTWQQPMLKPTNVIAYDFGRF